MKTVVMMTANGPAPRPGTAVPPPLCLLLCALVFLQPCAHSHPQPCQVLRRIGHTVRVGALHVQPRLLSATAGPEDWEAEGSLTGSGERRLKLEKQVKTSASAPGYGGLRTRGTVNSQRGANRSKSQARQREENISRENRVFAP